MKNTIINFNTEIFDAELKKYNDNLETYLQLEKSFEVITGSTEIKTIDYLNTFITSLSGFPNIEASVKLLDLETPYNFIVKYLNEIDINLIDLDAKTVLKSVIEQLNESCTNRLDEQTQNDYEILLKIAKLYGTLSNTNTLNSIISTDNSNYSINVLRLNSISQIR